MLAFSISYRCNSEGDRGNLVVQVRDTQMRGDLIQGRMREAHDALAALAGSGAHLSMAVRREDFPSGAERGVRAGLEAAADHHITKAEQHNHLAQTAKGRHQAEHLELAAFHREQASAIRALDAQEIVKWMPGEGV